MIITRKREEMPLFCIEKRRSPTELDAADDGEGGDGVSHDVSIWQDIPDSILLYIFSFLNVADLGCVAQTCKTWNRISLDESLWKDLFYSEVHVTSGRLAPGKKSWYEEVKRVCYHVPTVLTETLSEHTDEVLHVSFSHNGKLFSTTSKDATLKIWEVGYPTTLKYSKDFRELLAWDFTQFSSFNESDTMVLVSSVKSTPLMDRRGYMAILSFIHGFEILRVVTMDPSQLFGAWLDDTTFLGGSLEISLDRFATTVQIEAHEVPEIYSPLPSPPPSVRVEESAGRPLFTFSSETASLIKFLTVANLLKEEQCCHSNVTSPCLEDLSMHDHDNNEDKEFTGDTDMSVDMTYEKFAATSNITEDITDEHRIMKTKEGSTLFAGNKGFKPGVKHVNNHGQTGHNSKELEQKMEEENSEVLTAEATKNKVCKSCLRGINSENKVSPEMDVCNCTCDSVNLKEPVRARCQRPDVLDLGTQASSTCNSQIDEKKKKTFGKNLILVTGEFAVALHQIGFKNVPPYSKESVLANGATPMDADNHEGFMVVNYSNNDIHIVQQQKLDTPDHLLDLFGHVTGLCLTPDQRYLFINCRPWVGDIDRTDPWATPDLSSNIEVRIIDLYTLKDLGVRYMGHKGFSPPNMCCFVFLDVSQDFVASGSEDAKGYLWDRHFQSLLSSYEHESGVVNAVGFCPSNQEYLVTVSDDNTIKVWRSKSEIKRLNIKQEAGQAAPAT